MHVDMSEFHSFVDVDEHGILKNYTKDAGDDNVDEELEVINIDDYRFVGFMKMKGKIILKELSRSTTCSHGKVHNFF